VDLAARPLPPAARTPSTATLTDQADRTTRSRLSRGVSTKSLLIQTHPEIAAEWHPVRNAGLVTEIGTYSNRKVWWAHRMPDGDWHEWDQIVRNRTWAGTGCPSCARNGAQPAVPGSGLNRSGNLRGMHSRNPERPRRLLREDRPDVAAMFHPTRNDPLDLEAVGIWSTLHLWWRGECGHEWIRSASMQILATTKGRPCPTCSPRPRRRRHNLGETHPHLAAEWHPTRNGGRLLDDYHAQSDAQAWWRGACGHEWRATIQSRAYQGSGCPRCRAVGAGARFNAFMSGSASSLAERRPDIAAEWHPTKNGALTPADVSYGSAKKVWWRCAAGHEWEIAVNRRTDRQGRGCWCCAYPSRVPSPEQIEPARSIAVLSPTLAAQWHPSRNGHATPATIALCSTQQVWWRCVGGHTWHSRPASRAGSDSGCRACANKAERQRRAA
jgi:hypothetical protein